VLRKNGTKITGNEIGMTVYVTQWDDEWLLCTVFGVACTVQFQSKTRNFGQSPTWVRLAP